MSKRLQKKNILKIPNPIKLTYWGLELIAPYQTYTTAKLVGSIKLF